MEYSNILLVEGPNDKHVIMALCKAHQVPHSFEIINCKSDEGVIKQLNSRIKSPEYYKTIGIVIDADKEYEKDASQAFEKRWAQVRNRLLKSYDNVPKNPSLEGTILEEADLPKIGVWLMPNNTDPGMLEDFLKEMADPVAVQVAAQCVDMAKTKEVTTFKQNHHSKAVVHTYLAWQDEPGKPLGQSVTSHAFRPHTPIAQNFTSWLKKLFTE